MTVVQERSRGAERQRYMIPRQHLTAFLLNAQQIMDIPAGEETPNEILVQATIHAEHVFRALRIRHMAKELKIQTVSNPNLARVSKQLLRTILDKGAELAKQGKSERVKKHVDQNSNRLRHIFQLNAH